MPICNPAQGNCPGLDLVLRADTNGTHVVADALGYFQRFPVEEGLVPAGTILDFGGTTAPPGFLLCDGSAVSRITYARLHAVIGTAYGAGDTTSTFNLPDLRGLFTRGRDAGAGRDPDASSRTASAAGGNSGDAVGSLQGDQFASHTHDLNPGPGGYNRGTDRQFDLFNSGANLFGYIYVTQPSGGSETRPKNVYVSKIIKY